MSFIIRCLVRIRALLQRVARFNRKTPPCLILILYLGILAGGSLLLIAGILSSNRHAPGNIPAAAQEGRPKTPGSLPLRPDASEESPAPRRLTPAELELKSRLAEAEFDSRNYAEAEQCYRQIIHSTPRKPLAAYQIFTCMLMQGRRDEANLYITGIPQIENTPALHYAKATVAFLDGDADKARENLEIARSRFPRICPLYDPTLRKLGYIP